MEKFGRRSQMKVGKRGRRRGGVDEERERECVCVCVRERLRENHHATLEFNVIKSGKNKIVVIITGVVSLSSSVSHSHTCR